MSGVKNRVALVTGAGSANGIGYATANLLRTAGAMSQSHQLQKEYFEG